MTRTAAVIAACILGLYLSPAFAEDAPAYGLFKASLGCDKTPEGLVVTLLDEVSRAKMRNNFGIDIEQGDPCLASLALFPASFRRFATYANFTPGGASTQLPECLVWSITDGSVEQIDIPGIGIMQLRVRKAQFCDADGHGGLTTAFVADNGGTSHAGESCGATRAALTTAGAQTSGPISVKLKYDGGGPNGGLMYVGYGPRTLEVLECNVNEAGDD
ncbi:MAG: hypothetical protein R3330_14915, partial [Saprospiraceae bacterium]|nr:hypothetical protein [Saprospiraceae bacterium]